MSESQRWEPERYGRNARFVSELGMPVLALLDPQPDERVLDLGCGDGVLTAKLAAMGCRVAGVDSSPEQVEAARQRGVAAYLLDAQALTFVDEFDAVFSNAALHWMPDADAVLAGVWRALVPGGRFVAEFGGAGNVSRVRSALHEALASRGIDPWSVDPWYFPSVREYRRRLERAGFAIRMIGLFPRPTALPGDITAWLETFAGSFISALPAPEQADFLAEVRERLLPLLGGADGQWVVDYVRLRFAAHKQVDSR